MISTGRLVAGKASKSLLVNQRRTVVNQTPMGKRQLEQLKNWMPSTAVFGATSFVGMLYFTDWRVVNEWIPFYGGKFKPEPEPKEK